MTLHVFNDVVQGTEEWFAQRRGHITASVVGKLITIGAPDVLEYKCDKCAAEPGLSCVSLSRKDRAPIKTIHDERTKTAADDAKSAPPVLEVAENDTSYGITATLAAERIAGWTEETYANADMQRGTESEPYARDIYSGLYQQAVEVGFMLRVEDTWSLGYSPDGLVADDGLLEIKSPRAKTHVLTTLADKVPAHYMAQCQAGLLVSGRKWIDWVSYCGGLPLYVKRVYPDPDWFEAITNACIAFETNATALVNDYHRRVEGQPTTERIDLNLVELKL